MARAADRPPVEHFASRRKREAIERVVFQEVIGAVRRLPRMNENSATAIALSVSRKVGVRTGKAKV